MSRASRRQFLQQATALGVGLYVSGVRSATAETSPNEKLNIGIIGAAGRGGENLNGVAGENIVAICDVDQRMAGPAWERFPQAARYSDFRKMLDEQQLDAVVVSTPDHMHAVCSVLAMRRGLHCYCEKPLARTVGEARLITQTAREYHVVTQLGTQIHAGSNYRRVVEIVQSGAIGAVREAHVWVGKGWGGTSWPIARHEPPAELDWEQWLGPAPYRPYHPAYLPREWRRWWDFGGGTLSDMGCHYMDLVFWALNLRYPTSCRAEGPPPHPQTAPSGVKVVWEFPPGDSTPPVSLTWTDGDLAQNIHDGHEFKGAGVYFVGDRGSLFADYGSYKLFPEEQFADFKPPEPTIPDSIGHHAEWIDACKTGGPTTCDFDYSGPLSETVLLGTVAYRLGRPIEWDAIELTATNAPDAATIIHQPYRKGWEL
ncbi:MAG: Gfo/Idh/MocA family oxidoreductase [Planctomycetaceae bacterium]|nr:Gfo/Idh/MocA family oxidoreductase [Planctomycetaceae bacterium]